MRHAEYLTTGYAESNEEKVFGKVRAHNSCWWWWRWGWGGEEAESSI